jgi:hypothetical protein
MMQFVVSAVLLASLSSVYAAAVAPPAVAHHVIMNVVNAQLAPDGFSRSRQSRVSLNFDAHF